MYRNLKVVLTMISLFFVLIESTDNPLSITACDKSQFDAKGCTCYTCSSDNTQLNYDCTVGTTTGKGTVNFPNAEDVGKSPTYSAEQYGDIVLVFFCISIIMWLIGYVKFYCSSGPLSKETDEEISKKDQSIYELLKITIYNKCCETIETDDKKNRSLVAYVSSNVSLTNLLGNQCSDDPLPLATRRAQFLLDIFLVIGLGALFSTVSSSGKGCSVTANLSYCATCTCSYQCDYVTLDCNGCECPGSSGCSQYQCSSSGSQISNDSSSSSNSCLDINFSDGVDDAFPVSLLSNFLTILVGFGADKIIVSFIENSTDKTITNVSRVNFLWFEYIIIFFGIFIMTISIIKSSTIEIGDKPNSYRYMVISAAAVVSVFVTIPSDFFTAVGTYIACYCVKTFIPINNLVDKSNVISELESNIAKDDDVNVKSIDVAMK